MQAVRFFLLNASLIAVGILALFAVAQSLIYSRRRMRRRFAERRAFVTIDSHEAHSISFLRF
jgi:hypothetical protein